MSGAGFKLSFKTQTQHSIHRNLSEKPLVARWNFLDWQTKKQETLGLPTCSKASTCQPTMLQGIRTSFQGGEKQRVAIARAFAAEPDLIVCDEPLSALDVSVQAAILNLLVELRRSSNAAYLFISHDLSVVRYLSDRVAVMYMGRLCEIGSPEEVFVPPYHPYTEALLSAISLPDPNIDQESIRLEGSVPSPINPKSGCRFASRCPRKVGDICETKIHHFRIMAINIESIATSQEKQLEAMRPVIRYQDSEDPVV